MPRRWWEEKIPGWDEKQYEKDRDEFYQEMYDKHGEKWFEGVFDEDPYADCEEDWNPYDYYDDDDSY